MNSAMMPRPMTRAQSQELGKGLNVIVLGLLRPSEGRVGLSWTAKRRFDSELN